MNLPTLIETFVKAQNDYNSAVYANTFSTTAIVFDEGKNHHGRLEIKAWNEEANEKYKTVIAPIAYSESGNNGLLSVQVSGTFDGSPIVLNYQFEFAGNLIQSLKITG